MLRRRLSRRTVAMKTKFALDDVVADTPCYMPVCISAFDARKTLRTLPKPVERRMKHINEFNYCRSANSNARQFLCTILLISSHQHMCGISNNLAVDMFAYQHTITATKLHLP